jgi:simple sugar transport system permease protein
MTFSLRRNPLLPILVALSFALLEALLASRAPGSALAAFFGGPFASPWALSTLIDSSAPLLVSALAAGLAFRAGIFNLGGEGQAALGLLAGSLVLSHSAPLPPFLAIPLALVVAALAGGALALLSGLAERRFGASVLLTTFLFSQATLVVVDWLLAGPLRDPGSNLLGMPALPQDLLFPRLIKGLPLSLAPVLALLIALVLILGIKATRSGFELGLFGLSRRFAHTQGFDENLDLWPLALSGALSGVAGLFVVLGSSGQAVQGMSAGLGWNGLAISLVAGTDPLIALPASLFFAFLDAGARSAAILSDLSPETAAVMKALVLLLVTARFTLGKSGGRARPPSSSVPETTPGGRSS